MDDSLISEGTRARARASEQLKGATRASPRDVVSSDANLLDGEGIGVRAGERVRAIDPARPRDARVDASTPAWSKTLPVASEDPDAAADEPSPLARAARSSSRPPERARARMDAGARRNQAVAVDGDNMHKWRAVQTWASVDVEASRARAKGTARATTSTATATSARFGDALAREARAPARVAPRAPGPACRVRRWRNHPCASPS